MMQLRRVGTGEALLYKLLGGDCDRKPFKKLITSYLGALSGFTHDRIYCYYHSYYWSLSFSFRLLVGR